jgi:saccharopine dehydrogenase-like NADP-dependent oxidoreductase
MISLRCFEHDDRASGLTSMGRMTGFPAAIAAKLLVDKLIDGRGWLRPERVLRGQIVGLLLQGLEALGIRCQITRSAQS